MRKEAGAVGAAVEVDHLLVVHPTDHLLRLEVLAGRHTLLLAIHQRALVLHQKVLAIHLHQNHQAVLRYQSHLLQVTARHLLQKAR